MTELQLRKKTLLLESDLNRLTLHAQGVHLREATSRLGCTKEEGRRIIPWALMLATLVGLRFALGRRSSLGASFFERALRIAPPLIQLWRSLVSPSKQIR